MGWLMQLQNFILGHVLPATILNPRPLGVPNVVRQWNSLKVGVSRSYAEQFACCILPLPQCQHAKCFGRWDQSLGRYTADMGLPAGWMFVSYAWNRKNEILKQGLPMNVLKWDEILPNWQRVGREPTSFPLADSTFCPDAMFPQRLAKMLDMTFLDIILQDQHAAPFRGGIN